MVEITYSDCTQRFQVLDAFNKISVMKAERTIVRGRYDKQNKTGQLCVICWDKQLKALNPVFQMA